MDKRIYLLTLIAFVVGMVELIIGGILDLIALNFAVSVGRAGLLITMFAAVFAISGPVLLYLSGQADRKRVTVIALLVFFVGNIIAIFSSTYIVLLLSRVICAASGSLLTALCLTLAVHISEPEYRGRAIGLVIMGISGSIVLGLPIGVTMGRAFGWQSPFILVALLTLLSLLAVHRFFGEIATNPPVSLKEQAQTLKNKRVFFAQMTTFFFLAGHFTLYGYLTPFVITKHGFEGVWITIVYFVYGLAAVAGGGLAGMAADKFGVRRTLLFSISSLVVCLLALPYIGPVLFWLALPLWGLLSWSITPPIQSHLAQLSPETSDILQSLNNTALHLGIALGTFVGSVVIDRFSIAQNAWVGALFIVVALGAARVSLQKDRSIIEQTR